MEEEPTIVGVLLPANMFGNGEEEEVEVGECWLLSGFVEVFSVLTFFRAGSLELEPMLPRRPSSSFLPSAPGLPSPRCRSM